MSLLDQVKNWSWTSLATTGEKNNDGHLAEYIIAVSTYDRKNAEHFNELVEEWSTVPSCNSANASEVILETDWLSVKGPSLLIAVLDIADHQQRRMLLSTRFLASLIGHRNSVGEWIANRLKGRKDSHTIDSVLDYLTEATINILKN